MLRTQLIGLAEPIGGVAVLPVEFVFADRKLQVVAIGVLAELLQAGQGGLFCSGTVTAMQAIGEMAVYLSLVWIVLQGPLKIGRAHV